MPLLDGGEAGQDAEGDGGVCYVKKAQAQGQKEKQRPGELVGPGVQQHQLLPPDKAGENVDQPQQRDQPHPDPQPDRQSQDRQQLHQADRQKHHIRHAVQLSPKGACAVGPAGHEAVQHIAEPGSQVQAVEAGGQGRKEKQQQGEEDAAGGDQVGHGFTANPNN